MTRQLIVLATMTALAACASPKPAADSTAALPPVDTLKAAPAADSTKGPTSSAAPAPVRKAATTGAKAKADSAKYVGRDSVIRPTGKGGLPPIKP